MRINNICIAFLLKKAEIAEIILRLGFTSYEAYMDYLEFVKIKSKQVEKTLNVGQV